MDVFQPVLSMYHSQEPSCRTTNPDSKSPSHCRAVTEKSAEFHTDSYDESSASWSCSARAILTISKPTGADDPFHAQCFSIFLLQRFIFFHRTALNSQLQLIHTLKQWLCTLLHSSSLLKTTHLEYFTYIWAFRIYLHQAPEPLHSKAQDRVFTFIWQQKSLKLSKLIPVQGYDKQHVSVSLLENCLIQAVAICFISVNLVGSSVQVTTTSRQPSANYIIVIVFLHIVLSNLLIFSYLCVCSKLWSWHRYHCSYFRAQFTCCFGFFCSDRFWTSDRGGRWLLLSLRLSLLGILHLPVL